MAEIDEVALERALDRLPLDFKGPGGVAGVVRDGKVIARRVWGYADPVQRKPMTAATRLPICSISKQFTCAILLDQIADPAALDPKVAGLLPNLTGPLPTVKQLCDNQSGLRDYWALTVLQGAMPEAEFRREDALPLLARMKTGHFPPGAAYSYSNGNFRVVAELIERTSGRGLAELYAERLFRPAGMTTAILNADTRFPADDVVGHEGNDATGFLPARNGIYWIGDAGIAASLDDMLAWESFIDTTRDDPDSLYNRLSAPPSYADGTSATYSYGLAHDIISGVKLTGHGGALRGFRAHRVHAAAERLSVVVMFNHEANAHGATDTLLKAALGLADAGEAIAPEGWDGLWLDEDQGLVLRTGQDAKGVILHYATSPETLKVGPDGTAAGEGVELTRDGDLLRMHRKDENLRVTARVLKPLDQADGQAIAGRYWSDELETAVVIESRDGATFAGFEGLLGSGPMERMYPVAEDVWQIATRRSMDAPAPGDWTVLVRRDSGKATGLTLGCWLARRIEYQRIE